MGGRAWWSGKHERAEEEKIIMRKGAGGDVDQSHTYPPPTSMIVGLESAQVDEGLLKLRRFVGELEEFQYVYLDWGATLL